MGIPNLTAFSPRRVLEFAGSIAHSESAAFLVEKNLHMRRRLPIDRIPPAAANRLSGGFTLIELLVVLAILGLLAAIAVPQVLKYLGRAKEGVVNVQIQALETSLDLFDLDVGRYPTDQEGLNALVQRPAGVNQWNGPYVTKATSLIDPWGRPYVYRQSSQSGNYLLYSLGPDGNRGPPANVAAVPASARP